MVILGEAACGPSRRRRTRSPLEPVRHDHPGETLGLMVVYGPSPSSAGLWWFPPAGTTHVASARSRLAPEPMWSAAHRLRTCIGSPAGRRGAADPREARGAGHRRGTEARSRLSHRSIVSSSHRDCGRSGISGASPRRGTRQYRRRPEQAYVHCIRRFIVPNDYVIRAGVHFGSLRHARCARRRLVHYMV
jgi:hypothetical protein